MGCDFHMFTNRWEISWVENHLGEVACIGSKVFQKKEHNKEHEVNTKENQRTLQTIWRIPDGKKEVQRRFKEMQSNLKEVKGNHKDP